MNNVKSTQYVTIYVHTDENFGNLWQETLNFSRKFEKFWRVNETNQGGRHNAR